MASILSLVLGFLAKLILGWLGDKRADAAQQDLGRASARADAAEAAIEKERQYAQIAAGDRDRDATADRLRSGRF